MIRTFDAGATWKVVIAGVDLKFIRFADPNVGWAMDAFRNFWITVDGGVQWKAVSTYRN
jgi:photosystem II stability/assembly factor-like uncharacterized protein